MNEIYSPYRAYLESDCRYHPEIVDRYLDNLRLIINKLDVNDVQDISARKVVYAWKYHKWEMVDNGIQLSESGNTDYLPALKEFLRYLEASGYPVQRGLSDMVQLPKNAEKVRLNGLLPDEKRALREFLIFNIANETQQRDTALIFLLMTTNCTVDEALNLRVHPDGVIYMDASYNPSGNFEVEQTQLYVKIHGDGKAYRRVPIPREAVVFINFYLENRKKKSAVLFPTSGRKGEPRAISATTARNVIFRIFEKAGIRIRKSQMEEVLRNTNTEEVFSVPTRQPAERRVIKAEEKRFDVSNAIADETALMFPYKQSAA